LSDRQDGDFGSRRFLLEINHSVPAVCRGSRNCPEFLAVFDNSRPEMTEGLPQTRPRLAKFG
ncbi:MAG TPA: hypothetical protein VFZ51_05940, partial [Woeseiaceae bacterium]